MQLMTWLRQVRLLDEVRAIQGHLELLGTCVRARIAELEAEEEQPVQQRRRL